MIESAVLASIQSNGLAIFGKIKQPMELRPLQKIQNFDTSIREKPVLYRPQKFNFKAIDAIIVFIEENSKKQNNAKKQSNAKQRSHLLQLQQLRNSPQYRVNPVEGRSAGSCDLSCQDSGSRDRR
jgi:hypothetical protein